MGWRSLKLKAYCLELTAFDLRCATRDSWPHQSLGGAPEVKCFKHWEGNSKLPSTPKNSLKIAPANQAVLPPMQVCKIAKKLYISLGAVRLQPPGIKIVCFHRWLGFFPKGLIYRRGMPIYQQRVAWKRHPHLPWLDEYEAMGRRIAPRSRPTLWP